MSPEEQEKQIISNTMAITELTGIAKRTSEDVRTVVTHLDDLIPVLTTLKLVKNILIGASFVIIGFGTWITLFAFDLKNNQTSINKNSSLFIKIQKEQVKKIEYNKNQISYNKGRITGLYNRDKKGD